MKKISFGSIDSFILFGGTKFLLDAALILKKRKFRVTVFSAQRHLEEKISGVTLETLLHKHKIPFYESIDVNKDPRIIKHLSTKTVGFCFGAAWIFKEAFINRFKGRLMNFHGARLPQNRGAGGFSWQILRQNRLGYCLLHLIDAGVDTGNIIKYREFLYPVFCKTPSDFFKQYVKENIDFLKEFLADLAEMKQFEPIGQPEYLSIYWPRLNTLKQGIINWDWSLKDLESFLNAFDDPYVGASTFINGERVFLKEGIADYNDGPFHPFQTGIVYRKSNNAIFIAAHEGTLIVGKILDEQNRNRLPDINIGDRFFTAAEHLEEANSYRPTYTPSGLKEV